MVNDKYQITKLSPNFAIKVLPEARGFTLSEFDKLHINSLWKKEAEDSAKRLFNGQILNFVRWEGETLIGEFIEYKFYLAQVRDEGLRSLLNIEPIGASGITLTGDKVLFGKRSSYVTTYPEYYELVPSGSVDDGALLGDKIDLKKQFEVELWEETEISTTEIRTIEPLALIYDRQKKIYELCASITVNYSVVREELHSSDEYLELRWVARSDLPAFLRKQKQPIVPISLELLKMIKILPEAWL